MTTQPDAFQLKGSLFTLTVMHLYSVDPVAISQQLAATIKRSPNFFQNAPIVLDLTNVASIPVDINFHPIIDAMKTHHLIPVGIRAGSPTQQKAALEAGLATFPSSKSEQSSPTTENAGAKANKNAQGSDTSAKTKVITTPVRSGQQVYAKNADLLVLAPVSHGAELLADGHIHVYGPLRGRALAGVTGDKSARIFCQALDAELISIAGYYQVNEQLTPGDQTFTQIYLEDDRLMIDAV